MNNEGFIDYYEVLEVSSNANVETIERVFRYLARGLHPDTSDNHDHRQFSNLVKAYDTLKDARSRAAYDVEYRKHQAHQAGLRRDAEATGGDTMDRHRLLSLFYAKRRRDMKNPGVGIMTLQQCLGCPEQILDFHLWYFREKGWVAREETGLLAITAAGVDEIEARNRNEANKHPLITHAKLSGPKLAINANLQKASTNSSQHVNRH